MKSERLIILFAKDPENESTKSKLVKKLGEERAKNTYKSWVDGIINEHSKRDFYEFMVASRSTKYFEEKNLKTLNLPHADLTQNLKYLFEKGLEISKKVIMLNPVNEKITFEEVRSSFQNLENKDLIYGPKSQGGLYLIGMNNFQDIFLENYKIDVLSETRRKAKILGLQYSILKEKGK